MNKYRNLGGNSNVCCYEIGPDYIVVEFKDGSVYVYTYRSAGRYHIEKMKTLAVQGSGLNSYIMINCKKSYERRIN